MKNKILKKILNIEVDKDIAGINAIDLYEQLIVSEDIDEDLDKTHVMYSFCVILAEEFNNKANIIEAELDKWAGKKWAKLKSSVRKKYTDNDAKRKIESSSHHLRQKLLISKYRKLHRQLAFGGGKALEIKANSLSQKIYRANKMLKDFNVRDEQLRDEKVRKSIKSRLKKGV